MEFPRRTSTCWSRCPNIVPTVTGPHTWETGKLSYKLSQLSYLGNRQLVEYIIGENAMDPMTNNTEKTDIVRVLTVFKRKWNYHFWTIFVQSVVLIGVAYMTFYFKLSNFQV